MAFMRCLEATPEDASVFAAVENTASPTTLREVSVATLNRWVESRDEINTLRVLGSKQDTGSVEIDLKRLSKCRRYFLKMEISARPEVPDSSWETEFVRGHAELIVDHLKLSSVETQTLGNLMGNLVRVDHLELEDIANLDSSIYHHNLMVLQISGLATGAMPDGIENSSVLKDLAVTGTRCTEIPEEVSDMENLKVVRLENNRLRSCPHLPYASEVYLWQNELREIPDWVAGYVTPRTVKYPRVVIDLTGNPIVSASSTLNAATGIKSADSFVDIFEVQRARRKARNHDKGKMVHLARNKIRAIPPWLCRSSALILFGMDTLDGHTRPPLGEGGDAGNSGILAVPGRKLSP